MLLGFFAQEYVMWFRNKLIVINDWDNQVNLTGVDIFVVQKWNGCHEICGQFIV